MAELQDLVTSLRQEAESLRPQIAQRDGAIRDLQDLLAGARRELSHQRQYSSELQELMQREIAWRDEAIAELQRGIKNLQREVETARANLQTTRDELASARLTLDEQTEHLDAMTAQLEFMAGREDELRAMLLDAHEQLLARDAEAAHLRTTVALELEQARAYIAHVHGSRLWRIASAYWAFGNWLRRLLGR